MLRLMACVVLMLIAMPALASRQLTDETGRRITMPDHPRRIICLTPSLTETVYALGAGDAVVGVTDYPAVLSDAQTKPSVGGLINPSLEKIVDLRPDLVLAQKDLNTRETVDELEHYKIPTYVVAPRDLEGILSAIRDIGEAIGLEQKAVDVETRLRRRWKTVAERVRKLHRPAILVVIWPDPVISAGKYTFISGVIRAAGGQSATDDILEDWPQISIEEVMRRAPAFLLIGAHKGITRDQLKRQQGWKELRAVQQGHIIYMDERLEHPSPVAFDALEQLARTLHPEVFRSEETR